MSALLEVTDLSIRYGPGCARCETGGGEETACAACGTVAGCRDVSFTLQAGEVLGVVGESGSGKSTVLASLALEVAPDRGRILLEGRDITHAHGASRRMLRAGPIGVVHQSHRLGLELSVSAGGNIASRLIGAGWRSYGQLRERSLALYGEVELPQGRFDVAVRGFSGGMRQRVQLARALASSPRLLLLDEPTTGLDVSVQARILDLIRRIRRTTGVAMIVVSHDLAVIRMLAERVLVMRAGRVVEFGLTDQVLDDPGHPYTQLLVSSQLL